MGGLVSALSTPVAGQVMGAPQRFLSASLFNFKNDTCADAVYVSCLQKLKGWFSFQLSVQLPNVREGCAMDLDCEIN